MRLGFNFIVTHQIKHGKLLQTMINASKFYSQPRSTHIYIYPLNFAAICNLISFLQKNLLFYLIILIENENDVLTLYSFLL